LRIEIRRIVDLDDRRRTLEGLVPEEEKLLVCHG
jgi:hypothetical protein